MELLAYTSLLYIDYEAQLEVPTLYHSIDLSRFSYHLSQDFESNLERRIKYIYIQLARFLYDHLDFLKVDAAIFLTKHSERLTPAYGQYYPHLLRLKDLIYVGGSFLGEDQVLQEEYFYLQEIPFLQHGVGVANFQVKNILHLLDYLATLGFSACNRHCIKQIEFYLLSNTKRVMVITLDD